MLLAVYAQECQNMSDTRLCPITGQPLPAADNKAIISRKAAEDFQIQLNNLPDKFKAAHLALNPARAENPGSRPQPSSKAPINLHALSILIDAEHIIHLWATDILTNTYPGTYLTKGDWHTAQKILQNADLTHYTPAPDMIEEISHQLRQLDTLKERPAPDQGITELERLAKLDQLKTSWLTINAASQAITLYTHQPLPKRTIYNWINAGKLRTQGTTPIRVHFPELLALHDMANEQV